MTDEKKLRITKDAFIEKVESIETWTAFKTILSQITKTKVKKFIKNNLTIAEQDQTDIATHSTGMAVELGSLITEVDNI